MSRSSNMSALKAAIRNQMRAALQETASKAYEDTLLWEQNYYGGGTPQEYERIGVFGIAAQINPIKDSGDVMTVDVGRDGDYTYDTGSKPSGTTVFGWAENSEAGLVGLPNTWQYTEEMIQTDLDSIFSKYFSRS